MRRCHGSKSFKPFIDDTLNHKKNPIKNRLAPGQLKIEKKGKNRTSTNYGNTPDLTPITI